MIQFNKPCLGLQDKSEKEFFEDCYNSILVDGKIMSVGLLLARSAQLFSNEVALMYRGRSITYRELFYRACAFSNVLRKHGVKPKDRVLLFIDNSIEFYIAYFGIIQLGAVVAPLNIFLKEKELAHIIKDAQPTLIVLDSKYMDLFKSTSINPLPKMLTQDEMDVDGPAPIDLPECTVHNLDSDEMAVLLYTSGTTGLPKGVMLSSKNIMTNVLQGLARLRFWGDERLLGILPLFHSFAQNACVWTPLFAGVTVILVPKVERRYILEGLQQKPTIFLGVPALYGLLCLMKTAPLEDIKYFLSGGDVLPDRIRAAFALIYRRKIISGYGLTETSPFISATLEDETMPTSNVGYPAYNVGVSVRDEQGSELPQGSIGQLWVKGDNIMLGYYNAPDMTAKVIKDGWFDTGDLAYLDKKGRIVISGRVKDLIIHKGFNIYPQEIENVIQGYSNVLRVGVIGKRVDAEGETPIAFIQIIKEEPGIEDKLKKLCSEHLAVYKVPKQFICSKEELPLTATGKVDKKVLRKRV